MKTTISRLFCLSVVIALSPGCSTIVSSVSQDFAASLSTAILDNDDAVMVRDGAPAYLI